MKGDNIKEVHDTAWEYIGLIQFMQQYPGTYSLEKRRTECHDRLCKYYGLEKNETKTITDNLDKNDIQDALDLHVALLGLKEKRLRN